MIHQSGDVSKERGLLTNKPSSCTVAVIVRLGQNMDEIRQRLLNLIPRLASHRVLVIGDLFLDEYVLGQATRLSREAPIPVLEFTRRFYVPGGAANPAHNVCALGGQAAVIGIIGQDPAGRQLLSELRQVGIDPSGVVVDHTRPTTTKTRILAEGSLRFPQQVARIDHVDRRSVSPEVEDALIAQIQTLSPQVEAILVSDYQTGVASPAVIQAVREIARAQGKLCTVDAQGAFQKYAGFHLVKGNRQEVETALGCPLQREEDYHQAGEELLRQLDVEAVIITRGAEGLSFITRNEGYSHLPAVNRSEVFDVTGAGDTVIAVATLALLAGAHFSDAARLANYAAGLVVRKLGNAVPSIDELRWAVENW
jgi:rfaE bifunctional protein kinase chain/domain